MNIVIETIPHGKQRYNTVGDCRREHFFATTVERLLADQLGVDWQGYDYTIGEL